MAAIKAVAVLAKNESNITGYVLFTEDRRKKETIITVHFENVPYGQHGFHIHKFGDLREGCHSLCAHYNPHNHDFFSLHIKKTHTMNIEQIFSAVVIAIALSVLLRPTQLTGNESGS